MHHLRFVSFLPSPIISVSLQIYANIKETTLFLYFLSNLRQHRKNEQRRTFTYIQSYVNTERLCLPLLLSNPTVYINRRRIIFFVVSLPLFIYIKSPYAYFENLSIYSLVLIILHFPSNLLLKRGKQATSLHMYFQSYI